jgi:hypothetical protein
MKRLLSVKWITVKYFVISFLLFLYSYTQIDLNLTLSRSSIWQTIQKYFQHIGYYERPLSTVIFCVIIFVLYALYGLILKLIWDGKVVLRDFWKIVLVCTFILIFSYPAFSYDFFNYIFTAKTVLIYHDNPFTIKPLAFSGFDPWLNFMRWTHLPTAYTPFWILVSLFPYIFGFKHLLLIMFNFKIILAGFYLVSVWLIGKITEKSNQNKIFAMAIFALNPLVIIESIVNPHNDIMMIAFVLGAIYLIQIKKYLSGYLLLALSVATKLMTVFLYPVFWLGYKKRLALIIMFLGVVVAFFKKEILPWYFLWFIPFVALSYDLKSILIFTSAMSLGLVLRYAPFIYFGDYSKQMNIWRNWLFVAPIVIAMMIIIIRSVRCKISEHLPK